MNEISRRLIVSENKYKNTMIPPSFLLKPAPTDLYTEIVERIPIKIIRISWISQYIEMKSTNKLKKSKDLQGFHQYKPKYSENMK